MIGFKVAISVCLPICNGERHLNSAIESVLSQSFENFELIVVDDCSEDSSFEITQGYASRDSRIKVYRNDNRKGLFANYNACLNQSTGEFIKPFAQDDILAPNYLDVALSNLRNNPDVKLFTAARNWIDDAGEDVSDANRSPFVTDYFSTPGPIEGKSVIQKSLESLVNFVGEPVCVMFRRTDPGISFDEEFFHLGDLDMWLRILRLGKFDFTDRILCSFRRHARGQTNKNLDSLAVAPDLMRLNKKLSIYTDSN